MAPQEILPFEMQGGVDDDVLARHCFKAETAAEIDELAAGKKGEPHDVGHGGVVGTDNTEGNKHPVTGKGDSRTFRYKQPSDYCWTCASSKSTKSEEDKADKSPLDQT